MDDRVVVGLYRHGLTEENRAKKYIGWHDAILPEASRNELVQQAPLYSSYELVITSDLARCKQTAEALFQDVPHLESNLFRELHFGEWETKTYEELKSNGGYREWLNDSSIQIPGGESLGGFHERLRMGWLQVKDIVIRDRHGPKCVKNSGSHLPCDCQTKRIAIVTHGGVIRHLLTKLTAEERSFWEWQIPFGGGYELSWTADEWRSGKTCSSLRAVPSTGNLNG
ncbi:histidine phosphatase family protein [Mangrovibacillus sp. Mu-81]|uniref:histidine phosphatase family protein n=1 Tax=Mangrovibacillus sp. Mu-81 TaxID=3121478 RepID=UPI002FE4C175